MKKDIYQKILDNQLDDLTNSEKEEADSLFTNEQEFFAVQQVLKSAKNMQKKQNELTLSPDIKIQLDQLIDNQKQAKGNLWYNSSLLFLWNDNKKWTQQNALKIAAVLIIILTILPFVPIKNEPIIQTASNEKIQKEETTSLEKKSETSKTNHTDDNINTKDTSEETLNLTMAEKEEFISFPPAPVAEQIEDVLSYEEKDYNPQSVIPAESTMGAAVDTFKHPDGIYKKEEGAKIDKDDILENKMYSVKNNSNLLKYLKACY
ncbi:MAG: hypothetical protein HYU67_04925 [Flavobacteriia bacterium]|nr:hypothetical protein [Flavobacteriia bacterium]